MTHHSKLIRIILSAFMVSVSAYMPSQLYVSRRDAIYTIAAAPAIPAVALSLDKPKPICVFGASGQTGVECVKQLASQHQHVRAISRHWIKTEQLEDLDLVSRSYIQDINADIKDASVIDNLVKGSKSVIFLANAKKYNRYVKSDTEEFQNYEDIDILALQNIVKSCIGHNVPRLVYVSASCRSCLEDDTLEIDKMSGIKCENCVSKRAGENLIRKLYRQAVDDGKTNVDYTVVRIGLLLQSYVGERRNVSEIEINQDFTKSGMISKYDLADLCINAATHANTASTTFEAYYRDTTQPFDIKESLDRCTILGKSIEECFFGAEYKNKKPKDLEEVRKSKMKGSIFTTGFESSGNTWDDLFRNLKRD